MNLPADQPAGERDSRAAKAAAGEVLSSQLLQGRTEVLIRHGEEVYRLKLTRNGKLILHK